MCDLDIPREKWLNYLQTEKTLIGHHRIWVFIVLGSRMGKTKRTTKCNIWLKILSLRKRSILPHIFNLQLTFVISNSKGLSEIFRDIRTSTYQIYRMEEKNIRTTTINKYICDWILEVRDKLKILWKRGEIAPLFHKILFYLLSDFHV